MLVALKCNEEGEPVLISVVQNNTEEQNIEDDTFFACLSQGCVAGYYNNRTQQTISAEQFIVPLGFKDSVPDKQRIACYCKDITHNEIIETVVQTGS